MCSSKERDGGWDRLEQAAVATTSELHGGNAMPENTPLPSLEIACVRAIIRVEPRCDASSLCGMRLLFF